MSINAKSVKASRPTSSVQRIVRAAVAGLVLAVTAGIVSGCNSDQKWHNTDISGALPDLAFTMQRASDGKEITADQFKGKVTLLYFGYTYCPDICPLTLANVGRVLDGLGDKAKSVRVLFVTVDPNRDTLPVLKDYTKSFGPDVVGLRGDPDQITALAKRYRVAYSVTPAKDGKPYTVSHSSAIYVFDQTGKARLLVTSMARPHPDIQGTIADLKRLVDANAKPDLLQKLMQMV
jgi:protein SCO1/2